MPSFSLLRRSPRGRGPQENHNSDAGETTGNGVNTDSHPEGNGNGERRAKSKRERIQNFLSLTPLKARTARSERTGPADDKSTPVSPRSTINQNKPLPSPPPPDSEDSVPGPPAKPVLKLDRIMATLSESDIEKLFSGAPQFFARSEGHFTGAPHPSVAYPWDEEVGIRDLTDHTQIEDQAWGCVTAVPHITRDVRQDTVAAARAVEKKQAHFYPRCRERPSMLSMQGLEKGTMGYQAALEMAVADALQEDQFGFEGMGPKPAAIVEQRQKLLASGDGVRQMEEALILDQLIKNGERYNGIGLGQELSNDLYSELFSHILRPPKGVTDHDNPYSLLVQIQSLLKALATPNVWIDFSHVEWRIRLGQILWGLSAEEEVQGDAPAQGAGTTGEPKEERHWLLLQILLACELLIRLDAITAGEELGAEGIHPSDIRQFDKDASLPVKWSLVLARAWLENIEVIKAESSDPPKASAPATTTLGWLASLAGGLTLQARNHVKTPGQPEPPVYVVRGRHGERQVEGLTHFARRLRWPDIESYQSRIASNCLSTGETAPVDTPFTGPLTSSTNRSSYFGGGKADLGVQRAPSRRRAISAVLHPSGWLSKSYVSGLVLPGEGLAHFLMSTLLENDSEAMAKLGPMANLCGGFVYSRKSFWSTACVVGRVLAAGQGSAECMGWVSSDITPQGLADGWVNIEVDQIRGDTLNVGKRARIWGKSFVEKESSVLGDTDPSSVFPADFIVPFDQNYPTTPPRLKIELRSLNLSAPVESVDPSPLNEHTMTPFSEVSKSPEIQTYTASISFSITSSQTLGAKDYNYALSNDVSFVTAHPCVPSHHVTLIRSPSSPTIQQVDISGSGAAGKMASAASATGHPLHKFYTYTVIHLSDLLGRSSESLEELLGRTARLQNFSPGSRQDTAPRVLVIDCITTFAMPAYLRESSASPSTDRHVADPSPASTKMHMESRRRQFGSDMEILVRAICAEKGWNALISRRRRGCLACAIREAGALAWKVIIRVD